MAAAVAVAHDVPESPIIAQSYVAARVRKSNHFASLPHISWAANGAADADLTGNDPRTCVSPKM